MVKCVIYCRVSSLGQNMYNKSVSLRSQESICGKFSHENKLKTRRIYKEINSAYNKIPPVLSEVINLKNTVIVIASVDRFSRSSKFGMCMAHKCVQNENSLIFIRERLNIVKSQDVQKLSQILKATEMESKLISERVKTSKRYLKSQGLFSGGTIPYGYNVVERKLILDKYEQKVIEFIQLCKESNIKSGDLNNIMRKISDYENYEDINCYDEDGDVVSHITEPLTNSEISALLDSYKIKKRGKSWTTSKVAYICSRLYKESTKSFKCGSMLQEINFILETDPDINSSSSSNMDDSSVGDSSVGDSSVDDSSEDNPSVNNSWSFNAVSPPLSQTKQKNQPNPNKQTKKRPVPVSYGRNKSLRDSRMLRTARLNPYHVRSSHGSNKQLSSGSHGSNKQLSSGSHDSHDQLNDTPPPYEPRGSETSRPKLSNGRKNKKEMSEFELYAEFKKFKKMMNMMKE